MTRSLKTLALSLLALAAIGVTLASVAQAAGELTIDTDANGNANLTAVRAVGEHEELTFNAFGMFPTKCVTETLEGTVGGGPKNGNTTVKEIALTPSLSSCKTNASVTHVRMNGCKFVLKGSFTLTATVDIAGCTSGKTIEIEPTAEKAGCIVTIGEQTGLSHAVYVNKGGATTNTMHVTLEMTMTGIAYKQNANCVKPGSYTDGEYKGNTTLKAFKDEGSTEVTKDGHKFNQLLCGTQLGMTGVE